MSSLSYIALSRGAEFPLFVVGIVFVFVYLITRIKANEKLQQRRLDVIESAVKSGAIDDATKRELLAGVTDSPKRRSAHPLFLLGWLGLFVGVALIVTSAQMSQYSHLLAPGIMVTAIGFAVLSMPIAARELQARTQGAPDHPRSEVR